MCPLGSSAARDAAQSTPTLRPLKAFCVCKRLHVPGAWARQWMGTTGQLGAASAAWGGGARPDAEAGMPRERLVSSGAAEPQANVTQQKKQPMGRALAVCGAAAGVDSCWRAGPSAGCCPPICCRRSRMQAAHQEMMKAMGRATMTAVCPLSGSTGAPAAAQVGRGGRCVGGLLGPNIHSQGHARSPSTASSPVKGPF